MYLKSLLAGLPAAVILIGGTPDAAWRDHIDNAYGKLPLSFEANHGQTDPRVHFLSRGEGFTLFLAGDRAVLKLQSGPVHPNDVASEALFMSMVGSRENLHATGEELLPGHSNYFMGSDPAKWQRNLETYRKVRYAGVYSGVDLVYYGTQSQLEYDFVVAPHADPSRIRLRFEGARPAVDASGDLVLSFAGNSVRFRKPVLYQEMRGFRQPVSGTFTMAANNQEVGFEVGAYDHNYALVIDPVLAYSSYLGGSSQQSVINGMTLNAAGEIYVTGITNAVDYPTTAGVFQPTCPAPMTGQTKCGPSSASAAFVSKIAANGQSLIYSTYLGGSGAGYGLGGSATNAGGNGPDSGRSIAVDANDNAWVLGSTISNNFPITADAILPYCSPVAYGFNFNTGQYYGTYSGCARYNSGGEYVYGSNSMFLVKLNPTGTSIMYGTFLGDSNGTYPAAIGLDATGNVYVTGLTVIGSNDPFTGTGQYNYPTTTNAFQPIGLASDGINAILTELSPDGHTFLYSTFFHGVTTTTEAQAMALSGGKIYIGGFTLDPALPTTPGALSSTCQTGGGSACAPNGFVAEFDPTQSGAASLVFSTYLNGKHLSASGLAQTNSNVTALAADAAGNVYAGGSNQYIDFPTTPRVLQPTCNTNGSKDFCGTGFVTKLSPLGALVWSTFYGSPSASGQYGVAALALDPENDVYITNNANGAGDVPTRNAFQGYTSGVAYITELSSDASRVLFGSFYGGGANIFPTAIAVDANNNIFFTGYTTGQLPLVNAYQSTNGGGFNEGFFAKISQPVQMTANAGSTPQSAGTSAPFGTLLSVTVADASNVPLPGVVVTFTAPASRASGTFANGTNTTQATTNAGGVATASTFTANAVVGGPYNVVARASGPPATDFALTNVRVALSKVTLSPASVVGSNSTTANTVSLTSAAPTSGATITLTSSDPAVAAVPASVTVAGGATVSPQFTITTTAVAALTSVTITASDGASQKTATLSVKPAVPASVKLSPKTVTGGNSTTGNTVTLDGQAPAAGTVVTLQSSDPSVAAVPASVTVSAGATVSPDFTITTTAVAAQTPVTISASYGGVTKTATLTVNAPQVASLRLSPASVKGGRSTTHNTVTLDGPAPAGGAAVTLTSGNSAVAAVPPTVTVAAGATSATFTITTTAVSANQVVSITAAFGGGSKTANLTVTP
jgi:hypothetical protein